MKTLFAAALLAVASTAPSSAPPWASWSSLRFEARPLLLFSGKVEMDLGRGDGTRVLETKTRASFLGAEIARSRSTTTVDAETGRDLEYYELSPKRGRRYLFDDAGYTVEHLQPVAGFDAPVERWKVVSTARFPNPEGASRVYSYYGLILHLRDVPLASAGEEVSCWVATSKGPERYRIRVSDVREAERRFDDLATGRATKANVRESRLRITPADPKSSDEGFLKMEGETEIRVEARSSTLLEIAGHIPHVPGRVELALSGIR